MAGRILYFNHDNPRPSGGVRTLYAHVALLHRNGFRAFIVHRTPGFRPQWFSETVPTLYYAGGFPFEPDDVVIIPEDLPILQQLAPAKVRKIVFCQNHFYSFVALPPGHSWRSLGVSGVLSCSEVIAEFLQTHLGWADVPVVHCAIDQHRFKPGPKKLQIAYMPRKAPLDANFIRGIITASELGPHVKWVEIEAMNQDQVAAILCESAIFLSLSHREGLGLPPLEAMASGCVVVGYHGDGGREYATPFNGFWAEEGNPISAAQKLKAVTQRLLTGDATMSAIIAEGMKTAARYTRQRQESELLQFMKSL